jgi:uncharacterized protein YlxW (UPF0749 family)
MHRYGAFLLRGSAYGAEWGANSAVNVKQVSIFVAAFLVGLLVSVQWPSDATLRDDASDPVIQTILQLEREQAELKRTVGLLRAELNARQQEMGGSTTLLDDLHDELVAQKMRAGLIDLYGPGVEIVLDDSKRAPGGNAEDRLIHDYDLRDVVSLLWLAGAEAISVNGERIVNSSSVYCVGSTILVNDTRLSPPYTIHAIGEPSRLTDHVENPGYLGELKARRARVGVRLEAVALQSVVVPAHQGSLPLTYARPGS